MDGRRSYPSTLASVFWHNRSLRKQNAEAQMYLLAKVLQSRALRMEADEGGKSHNPLHASSKSFQSRRAHPPRHDQAKKSANQKQKRRWCGETGKCNPPLPPRASKFYWFPTTLFSSLDWALDSFLHWSSSSRSNVRRQVTFQSKIVFETSFGP